MSLSYYYPFLTLWNDRGKTQSMVTSLALLFISQVGVTLTDQGDKVTLANDTVSFSINKSNATISDMRLGKSPNLAGRGGYFAIANSVGKDGGDIRNGKFTIVRQSLDLAEVSIKAKCGGCDFDLHYVLRKDDPGYYVFVKMARPKGYEPESFGQVRWSFYLNPKLFDYQLATDSEQAVIPDMTGSTQVQDATYRLKDGRVYTKYDFCDYVENHFVHGITQSTGGYGAFVVMGSNEYLGGPNKQYITVHSGPIIHRFLHSGHFMPRGIAHPALPDDWSKLTGPWFIYLNQTKNPAEAWKDAKERAVVEQSRWPYSWMSDPEFPLTRGSVQGLVQSEGKPQPEALVVLTTPNEDWQVQILGYNFSTRTSADGSFKAGKIRPGTYQLIAQAKGIFVPTAPRTVTVGSNESVKLPTIQLPRNSGSTIWQIGEPDRTTAGFKLSDQPRQYGLESKVPANLTYTIGLSKPANDWFYAQCHPGEWKVVFDQNRAERGQIQLDIGIAGQTNAPDLEVLMNGESIGKVPTAANSSAQYRSAILGSSYYEYRKFNFDAAKLKVGSNELIFRLKKGAIHYDAIRLALL